MKSFNAFMKKEFTGQIRSGKPVVLAIIFLIIGIMNPAIAKLIPWMMELFSDALAESGMTVTEVPVDAMTSWTQFYKNVPITLIVLVLMFAGVLTSEYQKGTLIPVLTKGLARWKVICSKALVMLIIWTAGFALTYFVTYAYNAYFWDNSVANNLFQSALFYYIFGVWIISLIVVFSSVSGSNTGVLLGTGGCVLALYIVGLIPKAGKFLPLRLSEGMPLLMNQAKPGDYMISLLITSILIAVNIVCGVLFFNKRKI